jgi:hypothetical protein
MKARFLVRMDMGLLKCRASIESSDDLFARFRRVVRASEFRLLFGVPPSGGM